MNRVSLLLLLFTWITLRRAIAAVSSTSWWHNPSIQSPQNLCIAVPFLIKEHYTVCLCLGLFIAPHLQPGKLTVRFETLEHRLDQEDNLTWQFTEGASTEQREGWWEESGWGRGLLLLYAKGIKKTPQEGGVNLETEKCRKKSIMKMHNILQLLFPQLIQLYGSDNYRQ